MEITGIRHTSIITQSSLNYHISLYHNITYLVTLQILFVITLS